jgi:deoxyribodipyrimidine photo-lyase
LLLTEDGLCGESLELGGLSIHAVAGFASNAARSPLPVSGTVNRFTEAAVHDGLTRASQHFQVDAHCVSGAELPQQCLRWCRRNDLSQVVLAYVSSGAARDTLQQATASLNEAGLRVAQVRRGWDEALWPHASRGYFAFKKAISPLVEGWQTRLSS